MNYDDNYKRIKRKIEEQQKCMPKYVCCVGNTGPTGPAGTSETITIGNTTTGEPGTEANVIDRTGGPNHVLDFVIPRGSNGNSTNDFCCFCIQQMTNIIRQIIVLYPNNELFITLDGGDAIVGTPGELTLGPNGETGVFEIINTANFSQLLSICSIDTIRINNATYNDAITYLPVPDPAPTGCCADCDAAIRSKLPVGTIAAFIITNTQTPSQGTVIKNDNGILVLEDTANNNISFISTCRIDVAYLSNVS